MLFSFYAVCHIQAFFLSIHDVWSNDEGLCPLVVVVVVVVVYVVVVIIHE